MIFDPKPRTFGPKNRKVLSHLPSVTSRMKIWKTDSRKLKTCLKIQNLFTNGRHWFLIWRLSIKLFAARSPTTIIIYFFSKLHFIPNFTIGVPQKCVPFFSRRNEQEECHGDCCGGGCGGSWLSSWLEFAGRVVYDSTLWIFCLFYLTQQKDSHKM